MLRKISVILSIFFLSCSLVACNTLHGVGRDIEKGGEAIQRAVK